MEPGSDKHGGKLDDKLQGESEELKRSYYAFQRTLAETMLSLFLLEHDLRKGLGLRRAKFELNVPDTLEKQTAMRKSAGP